jgi:esterase/lipase superfamily enzyme
MKKIIFIFTICVALTACSSPDNLDEKLQRDLSRIWGEYFKEEYNRSRTVEIVVATNRKSKGDNFGCGNEQFGVELGDSLKYGVCKINVPKDHVVGDISLARDPMQSSNNYFKILDNNALTQDDLIGLIKKSRRMPLVFVHGFNVRYQEALLRASQIAYDLKYQGPIILFTWPAGSGDGFFDDAFLNRTYGSNAANAKSSVEIFKNFLSLLQKNKLRINLVIHSMGHQVTLPALNELGVAGQKNIINELVLYAPDFAVSDFTQYLPNIKLTSKRITLYCSQNDKAMMASKTFNKNERLGAGALIPDLDVINVSLVDDPTIGLGHGYYSSRVILTDLSQIILGIDAKKRLFIKESEVNSAEKYFLRQ